MIDAGAHNMVHLAWIVRLFPLARLVIFTRHPADHCLAPWLTRLMPADDDPLLTRLGDIVGFYDHAMALWAAADAALPLNVHQFSLEEALADPPGAFARLYQFWLCRPPPACRRGWPPIPTTRLAATAVFALLAPHRGRLAPWLALGLAD